MVYVFLADGFEETEAVTPLDFVKMANVEIYSVSVDSKSKNKREVTGCHGISVLADYSLDEIELKLENNMIILPGGVDGINNLEKNPIVVDSIKKIAEVGSLAAICYAPTLLGKLNLLNGLEACCYRDYEERLLGAKISFDRVVVSKNIITSRGPATAKDFAFAIVKYLGGEEALERVKKRTCEN